MVGMIPNIFRVSNIVIGISQGDILRADHWRTRHRRRLAVLQRLNAQQRLQQPGEALPQGHVLRRFAVSQFGGSQETRGCRGVLSIWGLKFKKLRLEDNCDFLGERERFWDFAENTRFDMVLQTVLANFTSLNDIQVSKKVCSYG